MALSDDDVPTLPDEAETTGRIVVALFDSRALAEAAIRALKNAGFSNEQIGVATQDHIGSGLPGENAGNAGEMNAETGALTGGIIGGLVGLLTSVLIPGVGPLVVGGILASALTGVGLGAAAGGLVGALVGLGVPEEEARYFDAGLRGGRTLVTVKATEQLPETLEILQRHSADLGSQSSGERPGEVPYRGRDRRSRANGYTGPERRLEVA
jgi:hypothetical protein